MNSGCETALAMVDALALAAGNSWGKRPASRDERRRVEKLADPGRETGGTFQKTEAVDRLGMKCRPRAIAG